MTREETNRKLHEAMGLCSIPYITKQRTMWFCNKCGCTHTTQDFFTEAGFFVTLRWLMTQPFCAEFFRTADGADHQRDIPYCEGETFWMESRLINPERFARALAEFLEVRGKG